MEQIVFPYQGEKDTMFITTRIKNITTPPPPPGCDYLNPTSPECAAPSSSNKSLPSTLHFVANIESMTIQIDHSVRAQFTPSLWSRIRDTPGDQFLTQTELNMQGVLVGGCNTKNPVVTFDNGMRDYMEKVYGSRLDVVTVGQVVDAGDCSGQGSGILDKVSTAPSSGTGELWRSSGLVVSIPVFYSNRQTPGYVQNLKYKYIPAVIPDTSAKVVETIVNHDGSLSYIDRHGIRLVFAQTGEIGELDLQTTILAFVSGLALLSLATYIADIFMVYIIKDHDFYAHAKYDEALPEAKKRMQDLYVRAHTRLTSMNKGKKVGRGGNASTAGDGKVDEEVGGGGSGGFDDVGKSGMEMGNAAVSSNNGFNQSQPTIVVSAPYNTPVNGNMTTNGNRAAPVAPPRAISQGITNLGAGAYRSEPWNGTDTTPTSGRGISGGSGGNGQVGGQRAGYGQSGYDAYTVSRS
ncbi:cytochrome c oxidase subunit 1 [Blyttiomyces sp. JEL0837]|nr:cytochrome c oxidase subunit 1 [Blyttiomyces sp. JEL0837]